MNNLGPTVSALFGCASLVSPYLQVKDGMCSQMLGGLDSFWSTLAIMALFSLFGLPITVFYVNTLFLDLTQFQKLKDAEVNEEDAKEKNLAPSVKSGKSNLDGVIPVCFFNFLILEQHHAN